MATLATQGVGAKLINPSFVAASGGGDKVRPGPGVFVEIVNADATSTTVTLDDPTSVTPVGANQFDPDVVTVIPNGQRAVIPVPARFANPSDGLAAFTYSKVTSLTIAAMSL